MSSAISIAVSGMNGASTRLDVAASNIANEVTTGPIPTNGLSPLAIELLNAGSTNTASPSTVNANATGGTTPGAYVPLAFNQVDQTAGSGPSGTFGTVSPVSPSFVPSFDPSSPFANQNGLVAAPNVDPVNEIVQLAISRYSFAANAKVAQTDSEMTKSLLDIFS